MFDVKVRIAQTTQNIWNFIVEKSSLRKKWQSLAIIQEISYSYLETGKYCPECGVLCVIWESLQPLYPFSMHCNKTFVKNCPGVTYTVQSDYYCFHYCGCFTKLMESRCASSSDCCIKDVETWLFISSEGSYFGHTLCSLSCRTKYCESSSEKIAGST